jgi:hypothetical protein
LEESSVTKISATPTAYSLNGNPRQPVLDRLDEFEQHLDQLICRLSQRSLDAAGSNPPSLTANPRLPLSDIVCTVSVTAGVPLAAVLSVAFLLR